MSGSPKVRRLAVISGFVAALAATPAAASGIDRWAAPIAEASARFGIPPEWIRRVMKAESGGSTTLSGRPITSSAGAMGLMQLMPRTWAALRVEHSLGPDPHDPRDNILAGTAYLRAMYDRFGYPGLFGAYNAGPARYADYLAGKSGLPAETVAYVGKLAGRVVPRTAKTGELIAVRDAAARGLFVTKTQAAASLNADLATKAVPMPAAPASVFFATGDRSRR